MEEGSRGSVLYAICDGSMEVIVGGDLVTDIVAGQVRCDPFTQYIYIYNNVMCIMLCMRLLTDTVAGQVVGELSCILW
jgi:hypothetical protein